MLGVFLVSFALVGTHLAAEARGAEVLRAVAKTLASAQFLWLPVASGAIGFDTTAYSYSWWVYLGLVCGALGDVLLLPRATGTAFLLGVGSFLLGHVLYAVAFALPFAFGGEWLHAGWAAAMTAVVAVLMAAVWPWLARGVRRTNRGMLVPVAAYCAVISVMVVVAAGRAGAGFAADPSHANDYAIALAAALLFLASDLTVARDRFVVNSIWNRIVGLPMYYGAQILFATALHDVLPS